MVFLSKLSCPAHHDQAISKFSVHQGLSIENMEYIDMDYAQRIKQIHPFMHVPGISNTIIFGIF